MNKLNFTFLIALFLSISVNAQVKNIIPTYSGKAEYKYKADKSMLAIKKECPFLFGNNFDNMEAISYEHRFVNLAASGDKPICTSYLCYELGWHEAITIKIKLKDNTNYLYKPFNKAKGHTLTFHVGGHENPAIITSKFPEFCDAVKSDRNTIIPHDGLRGIFTKK